MNWFSRLVASLPLIPGVITAIEQIHGDAKSGADKKQLALESLGLAGQAAAGLDPAEAPAIESITNLIGNTIDGVVSAFNTHGWPGQQTTPAAASAPATKA